MTMICSRTMMKTGFSFKLDSDLSEVLLAMT